MSVQERDLGWRRIKQELEVLGRASVKIGLQEGTTTEDGSASLPEIGFYNEFGTARIPPRPAHAQAYDKNKGKIDTAIKRLHDSVVAGRRSAKDALGLLGQLHQRNIQKSIRDLREPENAPSTIERKGSDNPLIDSGHMVQSIRYEVGGA